MNSVEDQIDHKLVTVGRLFYETQLSKTDIASRLRISVTHVNRLLKEAVRRGIVEITIRAPRFEDIELNLRDRYQLRDVRVVGSSINEDATRTEISEEASRYFENHVRAGAKVGLSSGRTLFEMVSAIAEHPLDIELFPLAVFAEQTAHVSGVDSNTVVNILWFKTRPESRAERCSLFFPGDDLSALEAHVRSITETAHVSKLRMKFANLDYYFVSCAGLRPDSQIVRLSQAAGRGLGDLKACGIVGDIVLNTIDADGHHRLSGIENLLFSIEYEHLQRAAADSEKRVVLIAGGHSKVPVIAAALQGRLFNALITDTDTARVLLR